MMLPRNILTSAVCSLLRHASDVVDKRRSWWWMKLSTLFTPLDRRSHLPKFGLLFSVAIWLLTMTQTYRDGYCNHAATGDERSWRPDRDGVWRLHSQGVVTGHGHVRADIPWAPRSHQHDGDRWQRTYALHRINGSDDTQLRSRDRTTTVRLPRTRRTSSLYICKLLRCVSMVAQMAKWKTI